MRPARATETPVPQRRSGEGASAPRPGAAPLLPGAGPTMALRTLAPKYPGHQGTGKTDPTAARSMRRLETGGLGHPPPTPRRSRRRHKLRLTLEERLALKRLRELNSDQLIRALRKIRTPSVRASASAVAAWDLVLDVSGPHMRRKEQILSWAGEWTPENDPRPAVLARALVKIGYPPRVAEARARIGE